MRSPLNEMKRIANGFGFKKRLDKREALVDRRCVVQCIRSEGPERAWREGHLDQLCSFASNAEQHASVVTLVVELARSNLDLAAADRSVRELDGNVECPRRPLRLKTALDDASRVGEQLRRTDGSDLPGSSRRDCVGVAHLLKELNRRSALSRRWRRSPVEERVKV